MLTARQQIYDQDARTVFLNANPGQQKLGQIAETPDGRAYVYSNAGASALAAGKLTSPAATVTDQTTQTGTANAVGTTSITYTSGGTNAVTANQYAGGYFCVTTGPGQNTYLVTGNTALTTSSGLITVTIADGGLTIATTTSSKFSLFPHPQANTVIYPHGSAPGWPASNVPNVAVTATYYYWGQIGGYCSTLSDASVGTKGANVIGSATTDGSVTIQATSSVTQVVGYAPELLVSALYWPVFLTMNGSLG